MDSSDIEELLSSFVSTELTQIKVSQFIVHFVFTHGEISVESSFEHVDPNGRVVSVFEVYGPQKEFTVHRLIGAVVSGVHADGHLTLEFMSGDAIKINVDANRLESYAVYASGMHYVCR